MGIAVGKFPTCSEYRAKKISVKGGKMAKVKINTPAPDFSMEDFKGQRVQLSDYRNKKIVFLVFNRGFT